MNSDFLKAFSNNDPETMKQAGHIWKMLDDMAASDPDGYSKFVQNNIKQGVEDIKKQKPEEKAKPPPA
jgi:hypothetical protein